MGEVLGGAGGDVEQPGRTTFLAAVVGPLAAFWIMREAGDRLEEHGQRMASLGGVEGEMGRQLLAAAAQMREAGRQRIEAHRRVTSAGGRSEVPMREESAGLGVSSWSGLTTRQVAELLRVTPRQVINLIDGGRLSATWHQGRRVVDEVSVAAELERRTS